MQLSKLLSFSIHVEQIKCSDNFFVFEVKFLVSVASDWSRKRRVIEVLFVYDRFAFFVFVEGNMITYNVKISWSFQKIFISYMTHFVFMFFVFEKYDPLNRKYEGLFCFFESKISNMINAHHVAFDHMRSIQVLPLFVNKFVQNNTFSSDISVVPHVFFYNR